MEPFQARPVAWTAVKLNFLHKNIRRLSFSGAFIGGSMRGPDHIGADEDHCICEIGCQSVRMRGSLDRTL
jgi:hypothetical protein